MPIHKAPAHVGEHLKQARLKRGLLQREIAEMLGVTAWTVLHWEAGKTTPLPKDGPAIVRFLGYLPLPTATLAEQLYAVRFAGGLTQGQAAASHGVGEDGWRDAEMGRTVAETIQRRLEIAAQATSRKDE